MVHSPPLSRVFPFTEAHACVCRSKSIQKFHQLKMMTMMKKTSTTSCLTSTSQTVHSTPTSASMTEMSCKQKQKTCHFPTKEEQGCLPPSQRHPNQPSCVSQKRKALHSGATPMLSSPSLLKRINKPDCNTLCQKIDLNATTPTRRGPPQPKFKTLFDEVRVDEKWFCS